ncbi:MAG: hypothetical protein ABIC39_05115 [Pseudomonadota bacterium]
MKNEKEKIDLLLERNAAEQLAGFHWDGLNAAISSRLDEAGQRKGPVLKFRAVYKAVAVGAAAAIVLTVLMIETSERKSERLSRDGIATVKFVERSAHTLIKIDHTPRQARAIVSMAPAERKIANCRVNIIDSNGNFKKIEDRAAWVIISVPKPAATDDGAARDEMDLICML